MLKAPTIETRHLLMSPVMPADVEDLYRISLDGRNLFRWRFRGKTPGPQEFAAALWSSSIGTQMIARTRAHGIAVAHVMSYDTTPIHTKVGVVACPIYQGTGLAYEAMGCFIDMMFLNQQLQKIYIEMLEPEWVR
jgi:RimJ/RimL family protein N-acetyltransferase